MDKQYLKLNADLGEGTGNDGALMPYLQMCNISCGAHAGSPEEIEKTILLALEHDVKIGAHPSYPDRENFGRIIGDISEQELYDSLNEQLESFRKIADKLSAPIHHIKAHGALYHEVIKNEKVEEIYWRSIENNLLDLKIVFPSSFYEKGSTYRYTNFLYEAFADRQYMPNLDLMPRSKPESVITNTEDLANQLYKLLDYNKVYTSDGSWQDIHFDTICIHGDTKGITERLPKAIALLKNNNY